VRVLSHNAVGTAIALAVDEACLPLTHTPKRLEHSSRWQTTLALAVEELLFVEAWEAVAAVAVRAARCDSGVSNQPRTGRQGLSFLTLAAQRHMCSMQVSNSGTP
jgi:hypothetical protein